MIFPQDCYNQPIQGDIENSLTNTMFKYLFSSDKEEQPVIAEYIWIDGDGVQMHSKSRTLDLYAINSIKDIPQWNYNGANTNQSSLGRNQIILKPEFYCKDPFRSKQGYPNAILVLCSSWIWQIDEGINSPTNIDQQLLNAQCLEPAIGNFRTPSELLWSYVEDDELCFGIEQQYVINDPNCSYSVQQTDLPHYCAQGEQMNIGRKISEMHYQYCMQAEISIQGVSSEVLFNQWEYQIGLCQGLEVADQLWISRFILYRVAEEFRVNIDFNPKSLIGENSSGAHIRFSTAHMRREYRKAVMQQPNNLAPIVQQMISDLNETHSTYIEYFGRHNDLRLTGTNGNSNYHTFSHGIDNQSCSVRVPTQPIKIGGVSFRMMQGYLEDRRPASNMDPYIVCALITQSIIAPALPQLVRLLIKSYKMQRVVTNLPIIDLIQ